jgi:hypothetical protein
LRPESHTQCEAAISTLYENRLIVEDYILKMTIDIYEMKQALVFASKTLRDNRPPANPQLN